MNFRMVPETEQIFSEPGGAGAFFKAASAPSFWQAKSPVFLEQFFKDDMTLRKVCINI